MDLQNLSQEETQSIWNEEAALLDAGDNTPALEGLATAPETPQEPDQIDALDDKGLAPEVSAQPEQPEDPLAGLPEVVRQKLAMIDQLASDNAQLTHRVKTADGRVAAMQREFQQARQAAATVAPQDSPTQGAITTAVKNPEKWEQLKQDFPEWADAMEEYVASKVGSAPAQQEGLSPQAVAAFVHEQVAATKQEFARTLEETRVEGKHPDWKETVNTTDFAQWFAVQAPEVRSLAESSNGRDAIRMLDLFHDTKKRSATGIKQERGARLAAAATSRPGQTPPPKTLDDMSPQDLWNYEAAKRDKSRAQRGY